MAPYGAHVVVSPGPLQKMSNDGSVHTSHPGPMQPASSGGVPQTHSPGPLKGTWQVPPYGAHVTSLVQASGGWSVSSTHAPASNGGGAMPPSGRHPLPSVPRELQRHSPPKHVADRSSEHSPVSDTS